MSPQATSTEVAPAAKPASALAHPVHAPEAAGGALQHACVEDYPSPHRPAHRDIVAWALPCLLFAAAAAMYVRTMRPSFDWLDNSELITAAYHLGIGHTPGYPTFMLIGHAFSWLPIGTVAYRLNLMTAMLGALAAVLLYLVCVRVTASRAASVLAALTLACSYTVWDIATEADVFALHSCLVLGALLLLLRWRDEGRDRDLYLAWLIVGLSLGNHALTALAIPALAALVVMTAGLGNLWPRRVGLCVGAMLCGLMVYVYVPIRAMASPPPEVNAPHNLTQFWQLVAAPVYRQFMFNRPLAEVALRVLGFARHMVRELGPFGLASALLGVVLATRRDPKLTAALILLLGLDVIYAINYSIFDIYTYFVPSYLALGVFMAVGLRQVLVWGERGLAWLQRGVEESLNRPRRIAMIAAVLTYIPVWAFSADFRLVDASKDRAAEDFARNAFEIVEPRSVIVGDWWSIAPLGYLKHVEGLRPDVTLSVALSSPYARAVHRVLSRDFLAAHPAAYVVEYQTSWKRAFMARYPFAHVGDLVRVYPNGKPRLHARPSSATPGCRFGDAVGLVQSRCAPSAVPQGGILRITHEWTRLTDGAVNLETLTTLEGEDGPVWRVRSDLANGFYAPQDWRVGEVAPEEHLAFIPSDTPPGEYAVTVRVRRTDSHKCLSLSGAGEGAHPFEATTRRVTIVPRLPRPAPAQFAPRKY